MRRRELEPQLRMNVGNKFKKSSDSFEGEVVIFERTMLRMQDGVSDVL